MLNVNIFFEDERFDDTSCLLIEELLVLEVQDDRHVSVGVVAWTAAVATYGSAGVLLEAHRGDRSRRVHARVVDVALLALLLQARVQLVEDASF